MLATKKTEFRVNKAQFFCALLATIHDTAPKVKKIKPGNSMPKATRKEPTTEVTVPNHSISLILFISNYTPQLGYLQKKSFISQNLF